MSTNKDKIDNKRKSALSSTSRKRNEMIISRISSITRMSDKEVSELFPDSKELKKLAELLKIVNSARSRNEKINMVTENADKFGGVIVKLLYRLVCSEKTDSGAIEESETNNKALLELAGSIPADDLSLIQQAIEEDCERINQDEW